MLKLHLERFTHRNENFVWDVVDVLPTSAVLNYDVGYTIVILFCKLYVVLHGTFRREHVRYNDALSDAHLRLCIPQALTISISHTRFCPKVLAFIRVQILVMLKVWRTQGSCQCRSQCRFSRARKPPYQIKHRHHAPPKMIRFQPYVPDQSYPRMSLSSNSL